MKSATDRPEPECHDLVLYVLGALDPEEFARFERDHSPRCTQCRDDLHSLRKVTEGLLHSVDPIVPPSRIRESLLMRAQAQAMQNEWTCLTIDRITFQRGAALPWLRRRSSEIETKTLSIDETRHTVTRLVRMPPGSQLPAHRHGGVEESYILEGELIVAGVLMRAGDYCHAEEGTVHAGLRTDVGCTFLAVCSTFDRPLGSSPHPA